MGWATYHIEKLKKGETVQFRPRGNSMVPRIHSGDLCTVSPMPQELEAGDVVLCKVGGNEYLHLIQSVCGERFQIGNNKGKTNGTIGKNNIFGKLMRVEK